MPYGFQTLSEEQLIQIGDNHVLNRGQMLTEVKCSNESRAMFYDYKT